MATVLRWAVVYWTLTQVIVFCGAVHPIHIQLNLDGKDIIEDIEDYERLPNEKYVILQKIRDLVKMWYNSEDAAKPMYNDDSDRSLVEKAGLIKLYIRGKFQIEEKGGENRYFLWDNKRKGAKELGEFVLRIFKGDPVVIVVFPDDLQTYTGFQFQKEFEEVVQTTNDRITVGRGVINVYLGLGDQNQETQVFTLLEEEIKTQNKMVAMSEKDEKYYSIFAQHHPYAFSFRTVFTAWRPELKPVNIFQVKILEADSVAVKLISACTSDKKGLKVGSHTAQGLADILLKLLRVQDVETHPEQRIRVELPKTCGTAKEREAFTGHLVDNLENKNLKVYGKEPSVHIHVYRNEKSDDAFDKDINHIEELHKQNDIVGEIENDEIKTQVKDQDRTKVSSAKELFIHIHCHGVFSGNVGTICGKDSKTLADILSNWGLVPQAPTAVRGGGKVVPKPYMVIIARLRWREEDVSRKKWWEGIDSHEMRREDDDSHEWHGAPPSVPQQGH
ncbi:uncharacterized protein LOC118804106 [Colossoma macropomum]|uniref:uncharacterized protein LOC118804106 n=1 Tax=Colossoma macropomum TaxID=42526 RepID=UPI001863C246|nr:uncharacterized protein LOC118804106 [Colossoma macropomum]